MVEFNRRIPYNVVINPSINNGFIVRVGCAELHYQSVEAMLRDIKDYLEDPDRTIRAYNQAMEVPQPQEVRRHDCGAPNCQGAAVGAGNTERAVPEPVHPVAICRCGASLDAMGRCISDPHQPTRR